MLLPFTFLKFWFIEAPLEILSFFVSLNTYLMELFALPLCIRTYFKPLKNEYRQGLVGFSIGMGISLKTAIIFVDLLLFACLLLFELIVTLSFFVFPVITVLLIFL